MGIPSILLVYGGMLTCIGLITVILPYKSIRFIRSFAHPITYCQLIFATSKEHSFIFLFRPCPKTNPNSFKVREQKYGSATHHSHSQRRMLNSTSHPGRYWSRAGMSAGTIEFAWMRKPFIVCVSLSRRPASRISLVAKYTQHSAHRFQYIPNLLLLHL